MATNMAVSFDNIEVHVLSDTGETKRKFDFKVKLVASYDPQGISIKLFHGSRSTMQLLEFPVSQQSEGSKVGTQGYVFGFQSDSLLIQFASEADTTKFCGMIEKLKKGQQASVFTQRTEESSAVYYFQFYGYLSQQQNMMQDFIRTGTYQRAILANVADFEDKIVLDVGAGSGILSFFALQAGAKKVYAVEASSMADHARTLVKCNLSDERIKVIAGKVEEIDIDDKVDVIISEPMGYMLYNERMLESFLHAKKWLKPNGKMYPSRGDLHIAPFTDDTLYTEQFNKANFWFHQAFYGINLCSLRQAAMKEYFSQPVVDTFDIRTCMAKSVRHSVDFQLADETDLHMIDVPLEFHLMQSGTVHGLAFWFDVAFQGTTQTIWLSTAPTEPLTHWYQVRCLLETPIFVKAGQLLKGRLVLSANKRQSYDVHMELCVEGTGTRSANSLDLKNPYFRYNGGAVQVPALHTTSPSEQYWNQIETPSINLMNDIHVNGVEVTADTPGVPPATNQANIHPGSIPSTGRSPSTVQQQQQTQSLISHYPVNTNLMIGDYVTPGGVIYPRS